MKVTVEQFKKLINSLKERGEQPFLEVKDSLRDKHQIGKTLSALSNSASYHNREYGYMIWGIQNNTWDIIGSDFNLENEKQEQFIYPQILKAFNYIPEISTTELSLSDKRVYVVKIKNCGNAPLMFNKIGYIRIGEYNDEINSHPQILKEIFNKNIDWTAKVAETADLQCIDKVVFNYLKDVYFSIEENKNKKLDDLQLLNALSLLNEDGMPNNTCMLFLGKKDYIDKNFRDKCKITWVYKDEKNNIEERLSVYDESLPLLSLLRIVQDKINKKNFVLQDINLFTRNDVLQYDTKVIEELLVNAIVHRDWNANFWVEIVQTPNSLEVRNPGKFRADLDDVLMENKRPEYLNPSMSDFLKKIHLMEKEGGGLRKVYAIQIKKGLSVKLRTNNSVEHPRVDVILAGKVTDVDFARFMLASKDLSQEQVILLDKIHSGKNILRNNVSESEFELIKDYVVKSGQGGVALKLKEYLLKKSNKYINAFSNTHTSSDTSKEIILDYAKKNTQFSVAEIYGVMSGKSQSWIRACLVNMTNNKQLFRVSKGVYGLYKDHTG